MDNKQTAISENRVVWVQKQPDGGLLCRQASGLEFTIPPGEDTLQAFVIWKMTESTSNTESLSSN